MQSRAVGPKVIELRTLPLQPYVNGRGGVGPSARKFNVSRLGLYSLGSPGLGLGWRTNLAESTKVVQAQVTMDCINRGHSL